MKRIINLAFLSIVYASVFGQEMLIDQESNKYERQEIIVLEGFSKIQLFNKTNEWIALNYNSANDVIQYKNEEEGKIIVKGNFGTNRYMKEGWIRHTLIFEFKDNKLRYTYTDFVYTDGRMDTSFEKSMAGKKKTISETNDKISSSISDLKNFIKGDNKDDW